LLRKLVKISESIRTLFLLLVIHALAITARRKPKGQKSKILIVRLDAIGDFILWLDAAKEIRNHYPPKNYEITLLGNQAWTSLAKELPYFDSVWPLVRYKYLRNPFYSYTVLKRIYQECFDIAINVTYSREFQLGDIIIKASGADERVGFLGDMENMERWKKNISDHWYTRLIPAQQNPLMELARNAELIRGLCSSEYHARVPQLPVLGNVPETFAVKDYYVIFPGAGSALRQWPLPNFRTIAEKIYQKTGWIGVVCGGPGEEALGNVIAEGTTALLQNWIGQTSLPQLVAVISGAKLLVSNETSAVHIAAAVSVPAVCILGGGHFGRFMPYQVYDGTDITIPNPVFSKMECFGCNWDCLRQPLINKTAPCICAISVDDVWKVIADILKKNDTVDNSP
jgi:ADP-heptose:LPS heptosyltransferase